MAKYREQMAKLVQLKKEQEISENFYKNLLNVVSEPSFFILDLSLNLSLSIYDN